MCCQEYQLRVYRQWCPSLGSCHLPALLPATFRPLISSVLDVLFTVPRKQSTLGARFGAGYVQRFVFMSLLQRQYGGLSSAWRAEEETPG